MKTVPAFMSGASSSSDVPSSATDQTGSTPTTCAVPGAVFRGMGRSPSTELTITSPTTTLKSVRSGRLRLEWSRVYRRWVDRACSSMGCCRRATEPGCSLWESRFWRSKSARDVSITSIFTTSRQNASTVARSAPSNWSDVSGEKQRKHESRSHQREEDCGIQKSGIALRF